MIRRFILFAVSLVALSGSITAVLATAADRDFQLRGYVDATYNSDLPFRVPYLGVNAELAQYDELTLHRQLEWMQDAHIVWVRQFFPWDAIEAAPGVYSWEVWDQVVDAVSAYPDLELVAVLMNSPQWARADGSETAPPDDPADFGRFARAFAERYGGVIDYYQIWDEPNLTDAWGGMEPRPAHYTALLQTAYQNIHNADSSATVIAAALAPTVETGPHNISDIRYLGDLYALGAHEFADAFAAKPYGFNYPPDDRTVSENRLNFSRIIALREVMVLHGDGKKALWASNWGWNSLPEGWRGQPSIWGNVSAEDRIGYTLQALERAEREWPWLGGMILQHWQPQASPDDPLWGFSLIDQNGDPTPLWEALAARSPAIGASNGLYPAANRFARYSGVWTFSDLGADIGWIDDSRFEFDFVGRDISLLLRKDNYVAYLYPTVDHQPTNATPVDPAGNAYIILTSKTLEPELTLIPVSRNLEPGLHTLRVVADDLVPDEAQDRWMLAGYAVSSGNLHEPYERQIAVAWFSTLIAACAVVLTGSQIPWNSMVWPIAPIWQRIGNVGQFAISAVTSVALMFGMLLTWGDSPPAVFRRESVQLGLALVSAGLIYLEPAVPLTLAAILILFIIIFNRLEIGLVLTLFWSPFFLFPVELHTFAFPMSEVMILITGAAWLLRLAATWGRMRQTTVTNAYRYPIHLTALDWAVIAWVLIGIISLSWAELRNYAVTELRVVIIEPALFYGILRSYCSTKRQQLLLVDTLVLAGFVVALVGLWMFIRGEAVITAEEGTRRLASVYGSPNNLGLFLGRCFPLALAFALSEVDRRRRVAAAAAAMVMLAAVLLSQSAGAIFIGVPAAIVTVILLLHGRRALLPLAALIAIGAAASVVALRSARFARLLDFTSGTNFARIRVWQSAINVIRDHPITGIGLDQFLYAFRGTYIMPDAWQEPNLSHPHNVILDFWVRLGVAGVALFIWIQAAFWLKARQVYAFYQNREPLSLALIVGVMGSMVNLIGHGLVDNSVFVNDLAYVFILLLGVTANLSNARAIDTRT